MTTRKKLIGAVVIVVIAAAIGAYFLFSKGGGGTARVKIVDVSLSACTMDFPTSSCGTYKITAESDPGKRSIYTVAGFHNAESELYNKITPKVIEAYSRKSYVTLTINSNQEVIAVQ